MPLPVRAALVAHAIVGVDWLWRQWQRLHVSRRGMYSLERLHVFHDYQHTHSLAWSVVISLLTPLPTLAFVLGLEILPLQSPRAGLRANATTLLRLWLYDAVITLCLLFQARELVPAFPVTARQALVVSILAASGYVGTFVLVASCWRPFGNVLGVLPFMLWLVVSLVAVVGRRRLRAIDRLDARGPEIDALAVVYPLFNAVFSQLGSTHQLVCFLLLPVLTLAMKNVVARISLADMEDLVPELALFTVELFHALYMTTCMQNAGSFTTSLAIMGVDVVNSFLSLRSVDEATSLVAELRAAHVDSPPRDLLVLVQQICHDGSFTTASVDTHAVPVVRLRTAQRLQLHRSNSGLIRSLEATARALTVVPAKTAVHPLETTIDLRHDECSCSPSRTTIAPLPPNVVAPALGHGTWVSPSVADTLTPEQKRALVEQTLRALFQCEYLVLTEYIECAMPLVYATYTAVLAQLPNAKFFAHTRNTPPATLRTTLVMVLCYAALEALSLVLFHTLLRRKLGISALHQLAFVLETQRALIQSKMLVWAPFILQFTLLHCGVDFTFRFAFDES